MINPSPDWFVGVSDLELCLSNGSWIDKKTLFLYPYDAGTDNGPTYISPEQPTIPPEAIRRIKPHQPNDPRSPFYDDQGSDMKPLAKLYITRQKLYEKNCKQEDDYDENDDDTTIKTNDWSNGESLDICETSDWSDWSECSCNTGKKTKTRKYINQNADRTCEKKLIKDEICQVDEANCGEAEEENMIDNEEDRETDENLKDSQDPDCRMTEWTEYGECSKECGRGIRIRTRMYINKSKHKKCEKKYGYSLEQSEICNGESCSGPIDDKSSEKVYY